MSLAPRRLSLSAVLPGAHAGSRHRSRTAARHAARSSVGDTIRLGPTPDSLRLLAMVAAVYEPAPRSGRNLPARRAGSGCTFPISPRCSARPTGSTASASRLSRASPPTAPSRSLNRGALGYQAFSSRAIASESSQTFRVVSRFHRAIAVISIVASAVFLLCIMLLKVEERRMDAAVMRFVGVRRRTIFGALLLEAALVAVAGSAAGHRAGADRRRSHQRLLPSLLRHRAHLLHHHAGNRRLQRCALAGARPRWPARRPRRGSCAPARWCSGDGDEGTRLGRARASAAIGSAPRSRSRHRGRRGHAARHGDAERRDRQVVRRAPARPRVPDPRHAEGHAPVRHRGHDAGRVGASSQRSGAIPTWRRPAPCSARRSTAGPPTRW